MRRHFSNSFWISLVTGLVVTAVSLHFYWNPMEHGAAPLPNVGIVNKDSYLSYDSDGVETDHYLYLYNLFGAGKRLREADLLLIGTSHVQLGLSARVMSHELSKAMGRSVRVYNMGLGGAEGWGFIGDVLIRNQVKDKAVMIDLYNLYKPSAPNTTAFGSEVKNAGFLLAVVKVGNSWLGNYGRSLIYPYLPRIAAQWDDSKTFFLSEPMLTLLIWRNWADGDTCVFWHRISGIFYGNGSFVGDKVLDFPQVDLGNTTFDPLTQRIVEKNKLRPILVDVPWGGVDLEKASELAASLRYPYLPLQRDFILGMRTYDKGHHLTDTSRDLVTEQLFREFMSQDLSHVIRDKK